MADDYTNGSTSENTSRPNALLVNPVFWISIATITVGLIKYAIEFMLKSKCSDFSLCWGVFKIKRDIQIERDIELAQIQAGNNGPPVETDEPVISIPTLPGRPGLTIPKSPPRVSGIHTKRRGSH